MENLFRKASKENGFLDLLQSISEDLNTIKKKTDKQVFKDIIDEIESFVCRKLAAAKQKEEVLKARKVWIMCDFVTAEERLNLDKKNVNT